ncbi:MAG: tetratricopeptide repeat protein, partial [Bacteroidota bacterium]
EWNETQDQARIHFYRLIEYQNDKPIGKVYDYYSSGVLQWEGKLISDRPKDIMDGEAVWYDEQGKKSRVAVFERGKLISEKNYNPDGTVKTSPDNQEFEQAFAQALNDFEAGKFAEALPVFEKYRETIELALKNKPESLKNVYTLMATCYQKTGKQKEYEDILALIQSTDDSWETLYVNGEQALAKGDYQTAQSFWGKAETQAKKEFGAEHPNYALSLNGLALLAKLQQNYTQAEELFTQALDIYQQAQLENHPNYAAFLNNLAELYRFLGNYDQAKSLYQQALEIRKQALGEENPDYARSLHDLAELYRVLGKYAQAEPLYLKSLGIVKKSNGEKSSDYASILHNLAVL